MNESKKRMVEARRERFGGRYWEEETGKRVGEIARVTQLRLWADPVAREHRIAAISRGKAASAHLAAQDASRAEKRAETERRYREDRAREAAAREAAKASRHERRLLLLCNDLVTFPGDSDRARGARLGAGLGLGAEAARHWVGRWKAAAERAREGEQGGK